MVVSFAVDAPQTGATALTSTAGQPTGAATRTVGSPVAAPAEPQTPAIPARTETAAPAAQKGKEFNLGEFLKMLLPALGALIMGKQGAVLGSLLGMFAGKSVGTVGINYTPPGGGGSAAQPTAAAPAAPATPAAPPAGGTGEAPSGHLIPGTRMV